MVRRQRQMCVRDIIKPARLADSIKHDIKKYLKKERAKVREEGVPFWDFDVVTGSTEASASPIELREINQHIDTAVEREANGIFFRITPKPGKAKSSE